MCITAHHHLMLTPDAKYIFSKSNELWNPGHLSNLKYSCFDVCPEISGFQGIFRILMTVDCFTWHQPFYRVVMVVIMCGKKGRKNLAGFVRQVYCSSFRENLAFQHRTPPPQYKGSTLTHSFDPELLREGGGGSANSKFMATALDLYRLRTTPPLSQVRRQRLWWSRPLRS